LADVVGRRIVGVMTVASGAIAIATFYQSDFLLPAFTAMVFFEAGATVAVNSLTTELFPTALRATAKAWITNAAVLGAMCGLAVVGLASDALGGHANVIALLAVGAVAIGPLLFLLPETRGRPLDDDAYEPSCEAQS
jgi:MFS family permease